MTEAEYTELLNAACGLDAAALKERERLNSIRDQAQRKRQLLREGEAAWERQRTSLEAAIANLQRACPHPPELVERHPAFSAEVDSSEECLVCGLHVSWLEKHRKRGAR